MTKIIMCGHVIIPADERDVFEKAIPIHIQLTLDEPGCLEFSIVEDKDNPNKFAVYEEFSDKAAFLYHQERTKKSAWNDVAKNMERHYSFLES
jgi:quinol monooxygenase YgiN